MPPAAARDLYERAQVRRERVMMVVTVVLAAGAAIGLDAGQGAAMMISLFAVLVIVAVGGRATDALRLKQAESILARLPEGRGPRLLRPAPPPGAQGDRHARAGDDRDGLHLLGAAPSA